MTMRGRGRGECRVDKKEKRPRRRRNVNEIAAAINRMAAFQSFSIMIV
jgi:hypothetical protein